MTVATCLMLLASSNLSLYNEIVFRYMQIHAPPLARVWLRTPISNILAIFAHRMHTLFSRKRANKEHPQTTFETFNFHSVKNIFVYSLRLRRYWPFIVIDFPDIANYRLAEALLEVVFLSFPESWWMPAKGRNIWQIVWGNCQLVKLISKFLWSQ